MLHCSKTAVILNSQAEIATRIYLIIDNRTPIMANQFELPKFDLAQAEELFAPIKALNALALANTEKLVSLQAASFVKYSNVALSNLKAASEVSDLEGSKAFFENQAKVAQQVAEDVKADVQEVVALNKAYLAEVQSVFQSNVEKAVEAAQNVEPLAVVKPKAPAKRTAKKAAA